jgi:proliferating cell nuclear antigen PCNA
VYEIEQPVTVGVKTAYLQKIMKNREKNQKIEIRMMSADEGGGSGGEGLEIKYQSEEKNEYDKEFLLPLIDISSELLGIPDTDHTVDIEMLSDKFSALMNQLKEFGDTLVMDISEEQVIFSTDPKDSSCCMKVKVEYDDLESFNIVESEEIKCSLSLKYVKDVASFHKIAKKIGISMTQNLPVKFFYYLTATTATTAMDEDTDDNTIQPSIMFYLAPKIDEDD